MHTRLFSYFFDLKYN
jgi:hypothetical protein